MANRLSQESSPYLLQHQHNPVDWYPWGEEAFSRARAQDLPVLLSIGYSACHWCHVMERESFEDPQVAAIMNERFVNVKVDREERPDVDSLYMTAVQRIAGHGGWPMTVFVTPEGEPFYGGTYFPPEPRPGMPSFRQLLLAVSEAWGERRDEVQASAQQLTGMLRQASALLPPVGPVDASVLDAAVHALRQGYDDRFGGFGGAPKFPQPLVLEFLLRHWRLAGGRGDGARLAGEPGGAAPARVEDAVWRMVHDTLETMARGGMYDQLGGGFHRYSVDARWLVPHFEKMLYDQAQLSRVYLNAFLAGGNPEFRAVAEETLDFVLREMTSPEGGFFSALDADSEGEEGKFYVWTPAELGEILGEEEKEAFCAAFGVTEGGNFEGHSILNLLGPEGASYSSSERDAEVAAARELMARVRPRLLPAREARIRPGTDDKVVTGWNAMMLRSLAEAGRALDRRDYVQAAVRNATFLRDALMPDGELLRTWRAGRGKIPAFLDDHALLADALVSLYQASFDPSWISLARSLAETILERFWSAEEGIFFDAPAGDLPVRPRELNDSATPAGGAAAATALLRLHALTGDARYERAADAVLGSFATTAAQIPTAFGELLGAMEVRVAGMVEVALAGDGAEPLVDALRPRYLPEVVVALRPGGEAGETAERAVPLLAGRRAVGGQATAHVCRDFACRQPVTTAEALLDEIAGGEGTS